MPPDIMKIKRYKEEAQMKNFFRSISIIGFIGVFCIAGCADADSLNILQIFAGALACVTMMAVGVCFEPERGAGR